MSQIYVLSVSVCVSASLPASETASENTENIDEEHANCCQACW